ncbi:MAG: TIM barrel protein [Hyphomicrobiaceae bacterium]|nr:MAG: TIM barrel protein [Hyphomicrobiaceae bacterium]KAB2851795.1 MAG: TIM barrel protein [Hyphomicrobiaceae bacterium]
MSLRFAANLNFLFTELPLLERFEAAAGAGFEAVEIINPYEAPARDIAQRLKASGLTLALFNIAPGNSAAGERGLTALAGRERDFEAALRTALQYADVTGCRQIHLLAGLVHQGAERATFVANLRKAARLAAPSGVTVLIEPINRRDIPGYFLNKTHEARAVIHEVGESNLGLQLDLYHRQVEEGDIAMAIREFGPLARHYQIANPPDRGEPDEGELNCRTLFRLIEESGFAGFVGCEYRPRRGTVEGLKWATACGVALG